MHRRSVSRAALNESAAATRSRAGGATKAMIAGQDFTFFHRGRIDLPEGECARAIPPLHLEHLVEVAVEDFTAPADIDRVAAHQTVHGGGVEGFLEQKHVITKLIGMAQIRGKSRDGQVGDGVKAVEDDTEMLLQLALVIGFQLSLRTGKKGAVWIIDEVQRETRFAAVA